jgi:ubiquitin-protein ligase
MEYFSEKRWSPTNSLEHTLTSICDLIEEHGIIDLDNYIYKEIHQSFDKLNTMYGQKYNVNIMSPVLSLKKDECNKGTGYSHHNAILWNVQEYLQSKTQKERLLIELLDNIIDHQDELKHFCNKANFSVMNDILDYDISSASSLIVIDRAVTITLKMLDQDLSENNSILNTLCNLYDNVRSFRDMSTSIEEKQLLEKINTALSGIEFPQKRMSAYSHQDPYSSALSEYVIQTFDSNTPAVSGLMQSTIKRITRETRAWRTSLPLTSYSSIFVCSDPNNILEYMFLITGPKDTPYENGCFLFKMSLPTDYPTSPPNVTFLTTGAGTVRFNPNLYNSGKVCLSLLGTYSGEKWHPDTSTMLQVMISIQGLIFNENPLYNEPGTPENNVQSREYNEEIRKYTVQLAMIQMIQKPPKEFNTVVRMHFALKKREILDQLSSWNIDDATMKQAYETI